MLPVALAAVTPLSCTVAVNVTLVPGVVGLAEVLRAVCVGVR